MDGERERLGSTDLPGEELPGPGVASGGEPDRPGKVAG